MRRIEEVNKFELVLSIKALVARAQGPFALPPGPRPRDEADYLVDTLPRPSDPGCGSAPRRRAVANARLLAGVGPFLYENRQPEHRARLVAHRVQSVLRHR